MFFYQFAEKTILSCTTKDIQIILDIADKLSYPFKICEVFFFFLTYPFPNLGFLNNNE